jgi:FkbM family methyltransferase
VTVKARLKALVWALVTWPPGNRVATDLLRALLPGRARRHPVFVRYARRVGVVEATLPDGRLLRMRSRGDDDIAGPLFWRGWAGHEPETARLFYELAGSARVTLDVGAHVGYFALLAAHANPAGRVYAFEPLARVRERLEGNVALNGAGNVSCLPVALGSPAGTAEFFHGDDRIPSSSSLSRPFMQSVVAGRQLTSSTVEVVEADDFVRAHRLTGVDLVKIDTETTEPAVVRGMLATLRRDHPQIVCEVLDDEVAAGLEALLAPLGYEFFLLSATGPEPRAHIAAHPRWRNYLLRAPAAGA